MLGYLQFLVSVLDGEGGPDFGETGRPRSCGEEVPRRVIKAGRMSAVSRVRQRDKSPGKEFWRKFEEDVERAVAALGNADVQRDVRIRGALSGRLRQIDVIAKGEVAGCPMTVIFEAKCYAGLIPIGRVDELVGKALDVAAQSAVLYSPRGFSAGAQARAAGTQSSPLRVGLAELEVEWASSPPADGVLSSQLPDQACEAADVMDYLVRGIPDAGSYPALPAATDDYGRFFRGEAPLFVSR
ncbi:restriction endonuclease [Streptomyces sp. NPDC015237]|uniref:restriction endonuclease n=1 Tax=Streptomyces sp. NPDC015237 TaxID=3364949 RepID=UPI0036FE78E9